MKSIILSEEEILCIQFFLQEISNIPMIECVYLVSYLEENTKLEKIDVITIKNQSLYYNEKLTGKAISRNIQTEQNNFNAYIPDLEYCTDNAAMIAMAGYYNYLAGKYTNDLALNAKASINIEEE